MQARAKPGPSSTQIRLNPRKFAPVNKYLDCFGEIHILPAELSRHTVKPGKKRHLWLNQAMIPPQGNNQTLHGHDMYLRALIAEGNCIREDAALGLKFDLVRLEMAGTEVATSFRGWLHSMWEVLADLVAHKDRLSNFADPEFVPIELWNQHGLYWLPFRWELMMPSDPVLAARIRSHLRMFSHPNWDWHQGRAAQEVWARFLQRQPAPHMRDKSTLTITPASGGPSQCINRLAEPEVKESAQIDPRQVHQERRGIFKTPAAPRSKRPKTYGRGTWQTPIAPPQQFANPVKVTPLAAPSRPEEEPEVDVVGDAPTPLNLSKPGDELQGQPTPSGSGAVASASTAIVPAPQMATGASFLASMSGGAVTVAEWDSRHHPAVAGPSNWTPPVAAATTAAATSQALPSSMGTLDPAMVRMGN